MLETSGTHIDWRRQPLSRWVYAEILLGLDTLKYGDGEKNKCNAAGSILYHLVSVQTVYVYKVLLFQSLFPSVVVTDNMQPDMLINPPYIMDEP